MGLESEEMSIAQERPMPTAVVFEKWPRWAPELERQFLGQDVRVVACRSIADVEERSANVKRGVILLDLSAAAADCLRYLERRLGEPGALPTFVIGPERMAALEWPVRDLGAMAYLTGAVAGHEMAALCRKQWL